MDIAIFSGRIYTGNPAQPWAEALKVENERITHVGSIAEIKDVCSNATELLEMPGCLVTPGLVDAHCHFVSLGLAFQLVDLRDASSLDEIRRRIQKAAAARKPGDWIVGRGWNHHQWSDRREPTRQDLDDLLPGNPAMMVRACGHSIWVNSVALKLAGVTRDTPHPDGGHIDKDPADGQPTGLLREARDIIQNHIPLPTLEQRKQMALAAQENALRSGVTGVHTCETLTEWEALAALEEEGKLKLRVYHLLPPRRPRGSSGPGYHGRQRQSPALV